MRSTTTNQSGTSPGNIQELMAKKFKTVGEYNVAQKKKRVAKNEFRYNRNERHMTYVFEDDGKKYASVGITHHDKTFGKANMPLDDNPQDEHEEPAFVRHGFIRDRHESYSEVKANFEFSEKDFPKVKAKIRNYKKKRKKNK